jgi:hypothetical protein
VEEQPKKNVIHQIVIVVVTFVATIGGQVFLGRSHGAHLVASTAYGRVAVGWLEKGDSAWAYLGLLDARSGDAVSYFRASGRRGALSIPAEAFQKAPSRVAGVILRNDGGMPATQIRIGLSAPVSHPRLESTPNLRVSLAADSTASGRSIEVSDLPPGGWGVITLETLEPQAPVIEYVTSKEAFASSEAIRQVGLRELTLAERRFGTASVRVMPFSMTDSGKVSLEMAFPRPYPPLWPLALATGAGLLLLLAYGHVTRRNSVRAALLHVTSAIEDAADHYSYRRLLRVASTLGVLLSVSLFVLWGEIYLYARTLSSPSSLMVGLTSALLALALCLADSGLSFALAAGLQLGRGVAAKLAMYLKTSELWLYFAAGATAMLFIPAWRLEAYSLAALLGATAVLALFRAIGVKPHMTDKLAKLALGTILGVMLLIVAWTLIYEFNSNRTLHQAFESPVVAPQAPPGGPR